MPLVTTMSEPQPSATPSWFDGLTMRAAKNVEGLMVSFSNHEDRSHHEGASADV